MLEVLRLYHDCTLMFILEHEGGESASPPASRGMEPGMLPHVKQCVYLRVVRSEGERMSRWTGVW